MRVPFPHSKRRAISRYTELQMAVGEPYRGRTLVVVCLLCLIVLAQSSALALEHREHHSSEHCCLLCHAGPLPFLQGTMSVALAPTLPVTWFASAIEFQDTHDVLIATSSSRAPPA